MKLIAWQQFGGRWCLTGQYGMRPILLSANPKGELMLRNEVTDRLVSFHPEHPFAQKVVSSLNREQTLAFLAKSWRAAAAENSGSDSDEMRAVIYNHCAAELEKLLP
jgi:hypothetical protein